MKRGILLGAVAAAVLMAAGDLAAAPYNLNGCWVEVDYWAGSGTSETIVVIDWNTTNGPYVSEAHAWGYRWDGVGYVSEALAAIADAGGLNVTFSYGGGFVNDAFYPDADGDNHTTAGFTGWWWTGETTDGGQTWTGNVLGLDQERLAAGKIEGLNMDSGAWTSDTLTIPLPEPATMLLVALGAGAGLARRCRT